jgi:hypothetical protein
MVRPWCVEATSPERRRRVAEGTARARAWLRTAAGAPDRSTKRASDDVDHLIDVLIGFAMLRGRADAALDVVLEDEDRQGIDGGS